MISKEETIASFLITKLSIESEFNNINRPQYKKPSKILTPSNI